MNIPDGLRIPFKGGWHIAEWDQKAFNAWAAGLITTEEAIERISGNNHTDVTVGQFMATADWLGYYRIKKSDYEV